MTQDQGLSINPNSDLQLDCYVDADFSGVWKHEDNQDTVCEKSRTGYVMILGDVFWIRFQSCICLHEISRDSSVGRAVDCSVGTQVIHRSLVRFGYNIHTGNKNTIQFNVNSSTTFLQDR
jgi:hypothetical protein